MPTKMSGANAASIKTKNQRLFLQLARERNGISRAEFAKISGLTKGGTTAIASELIQNGLLFESDTANTKSGRKPVLLKLNPNYCYIIAIHLARSFVNISLCDFCGEILREDQFKYSERIAFEDVVDRICKMIDILIKDIERSRILGVSVIAPGPLDYNRGYILSPPKFNGWQNIPLVDILSKRLSMRVILDSDTNAVAMAEKTYGGWAYKNFIHILINEGLGVGIFMNDKILRIHNGYCPEVGHTTLDINGEKCSCGNVGCAEMYIAIPNIIKYYCDRAGKQEGTDYDIFKKIAEKAKAGDYLALSTIERECYYLSSFVTTMANTFFPEAIFLGGWIPNADYNFEERLSEMVSKKAISSNSYLPDIKISRVKEAHIRGAASIMITKFINGEIGIFEKITDEENRDESIEH